MLKRQLGCTKLHLSYIGFGCAPLGGLYGKVNDAVNLIDEALQQGINYFDTSPYYGNSETVLGMCFDTLKLPRESYIISSKAGRINEATFDYSPDWLNTSLINSLERLKTHYLDIFLLHDIEFGNIHEIMTISIPYLIKLREQGKISYLGFSTYRLETVKMASKYDTFKQLDVVLIYGHNNLINNNLGDIIKLLIENDIGLIDASPLALGLLRDNLPPDWHPTNPTQRQIINKVAKQVKLLSRGEVNLSSLAVYYTLSNMYGASLLIGMENKSQLEENIAVYNQVLKNGSKSKGRPTEDTFQELLESVKVKLKPLKGVDLS